MKTLKSFMTSNRYFLIHVFEFPLSEFYYYVLEKMSMIMGINGIMDSMSLA